MTGLLRGRRQLSLPGKILLLSLCNLLLLAGAAMVFLRFQLGAGSESMLLGPASDKMMALSARVTRELARRPVGEWDGLLARIGAEYGARVYLTKPEGERIAGDSEAVPADVRGRYRPAGPPPDVLPPPPPPAPPWQADSRKGPPKGLRHHRPPPPVFLVVTAGPPAYWIGSGIPLPVAPFGGMLLVKSESMFNRALFIDPWLLASVGSAACGLSFLCWFHFVRRLTRAVRHMDAATERIAEGRFDAQIAVNRGDELGHLGVQINRMAARLATLVNGQKRFLGDVAHELSAPIARMQMALGILEERAGERDRASFTDLREEVELISSLTNELLNFSKAALRPDAIVLEPVGVAEVVRRVVSRERGGAAKIEVTVDPELRVLANRAYFSRSLANLVRNSIRYAGAAGPIDIAARAEAGDVVITVTDSGPGVAEEDLERILEPFYRPEAARTRTTGGAGLGLAIVKAGIESCRGSVACRNRPPRGLEVTIRLPATAP